MVGLVESFNHWHTQCYFLGDTLIVCDVRLTTFFELETFCLIAVTPLILLVLPDTCKVKTECFNEAHAKNYPTMH